MTSLALLQYGLTPVGLVTNMALRAYLTGSSLDVATSVVLLAFLVRDAMMDKEA